MCKYFGWTYEEYLDQPMWFINLTKEMQRIDAHNDAVKDGKK